jgi:hypothetical protein
MGGLKFYREMATMAGFPDSKQLKASQGWMAKVVFLQRCDHGDDRDCRAKF